jgi:hydroxymethylpyrimidine pyrophosphatase-like HAD family hydrolase
MLRLISTDFDGTLVDHDGKPPVTAALFPMLQDLRAIGLLWVINTGRTLDHLEAGLRAEFRFPIEPDYAIVEERDIYRRTRSGGWEPFREWNTASDADHAALQVSARPVYNDVAAFITRFPGSRMIASRDAFFGLSTIHEEEMDAVCAFLDERRTAYPDFSYQRNTIYLRFCHRAYSKGTALGELSRHLQITAREVYAVGDHHNDLPMLDGKFAAWVACPSNAVREVKSLVQEAGGRISAHAASGGVVESLMHFRRLHASM